MQVFETKDWIVVIYNFNRFSCDFKTFPLPKRNIKRLDFLRFAHVVPMLKSVVLIFDVRFLGV